jgi:hypothetical protein
MLKICIFNTQPYFNNVQKPVFLKYRTQPANNSRILGDFDGVNKQNNSKLK